MSVQQDINPLQTGFQTAKLQQLGNPMPQEPHPATLKPEHLNPPDKNGIATFSDAGTKYLGGLIPDNTGLIGMAKDFGSSLQQPALPGLMPHQPQSIEQVGGKAELAGKLIGSDALEGTGAALKAGGLKGLISML